MGVLRIPQPIWLEVNTHLSRFGEHFAFLRAHHTFSRGEPVFWVTGVELVDDSEVSIDQGGHEVHLEAVLRAINLAMREGTSLIEVHNHGGGRPRWSGLDLRGLKEVVPYMLDSLPDRPYGATVWSGGEVFGEWFTSDGRGSFGSVTVYGDRFQQVVSKDGMPTAERALVRQEPWFTQRGQRELQMLRVAIVGNGGTGSPLAQNLVYLGLRDFVLIDPDAADETSMNRLVTARRRDVGRLKTSLTSRLILGVAPQATIVSVDADLRSSKAIDELRGCDVIFGCLDNDGGRLVLNEVAVAYRIPYVDLAVGIEAKDGSVSQAGGRVVVVTPNGPCLDCLHEIDSHEAGYFLSSGAQRERARNFGYVSGMDEPAPSVVSVTAMIAAVAANELVVWVTGVRQLNVYTELDLLGIGRGRGAQWVTPRKVEQDPNCVTCTLSGVGDGGSFERYVAAAG